MSLPRALALAIGQLGDRAILAVLGKTALATLALFAAFGMGLYAMLTALLPADFAAGASGLSALAAVIVTLVAGWFLFRVVALFVLQFFGEDVVRAVERRHYPDAAHSHRALGFAEELRQALRSLARTLLANAAALPVAALLLLTGFGPALVFLAVNAVLVGRELQDLAWLPHRNDGDAVPPVGGITRVLLGAVVVALLAIPFVNLLAPIVGAATATHLVHRTPRKGPHA